MQNDSETITRKILIEELAPIKESINRIATLSLENKSEIQEIKEKLKPLEHLKGIHNILDKMANDFHNYREQQEIASQHMKEYWNKSENHESIILDHEGRIRELES